MGKQRKIVLILLIIGLIMVTTGLTMSFLMPKKNQNTKPVNRDIVTKPENTMSELVFSAIDDSIYLEDIVPTLDKFGVMGKGFSFSIKNNNSKAVSYELKLIDDDSTISNNNIRYQLIKNKEVVGVYTLPFDGIIDITTINRQSENNYTIKLWLDYNSEIKSGQFSKKIMVTKIDEEMANRVKPILTDGMIPVYYDNNTNTWYKANINKWYSYDEAIWANAVTVDANKRIFYETSEVGTKIDILDINSMWVWIPRFNYSLDANDTNITFVSSKEKAYPAFTFDGNELDGFWFSKFESGMKSDSECISTSLTKKCNNSNNLLYFVPNYPFATKMTMANMFYAIRNMELKNNIYGFKGNGTKVNSDGTIKNDDNNIDIHMIKNIEWQAVALLANSKYGNSKQIVNNNSELTGKAYYENNVYDYNVLLKGTEASTTGNVYGVYDMSGGKREYVMIDYEDIDIFNKKSNSGFTNNVKEYYYDNGFNDNDTTILLKEKYSKENLLNNNPITRGGYNDIGNIFNLYGVSDYIDKVSIETNSRACLMILKEKENEEKEN